MPTQVQIRPRLTADLAARIDSVRGDVTLARWVQRACEMRLALETSSGGPVAPAASEVAPRIPPTTPRAPERQAAEGVASGSRPSRAKDQPDHQDAPSAADGKPPVEDPPTAVDEESLAEGMPTAVQLAGKEGVTVALARRWLESGEWALYWP